MSVSVPRNHTAESRPNLGVAPDRSLRRLRYRLRRQAYRDAGRPPAAGEAAGSLDRGLEEEAAQLRTEVDRLTDLHLRARSDFENFRRRMERERDEQRKFANESLIRGLLETVDNLERAIQGAQRTGDITALQDGVQMVYQQFVAALQRNGVEIVDASPGTKFDPARHEAVAVGPDPEREDDTIIECFQNGYILNSRVLRPAMVRVAKNA